MTRRLAISILSLAGLLSLPVTAAADEIEWMYDPDQVVEIRLGGLSPEELDALEAEPDEYVKGSFELLVDGVTKGALMEDVGIRRKGGVGSSSPIKTGKTGFKVRFDEFVKGQLFFGLKRLTLNNMIQDPSMVHETLTYGLFHELGLPASRTGYAFVKLNGSDYGLFLSLETLDKISLPRWFATTQHLYEADAAGTDVTTGSATKFEVDEGSEENIGDLEALIAAVSDGDGDWSDGVSPVADLAQMTAHWAVERYASHWDGYAGVYEDPLPSGPFRPNNYYLHSDAAGVFRMVPWGTDQTWEFNMEFDELAGGIMFNECLADESCKQQYLEGLTDIHCAAPGLELDTHAAQLAAMLAPYQAKEDPGRREATAGEIAEAVDDVEALTAARPSELEDYLTVEAMLGSGPDPCAEPEEPEEPEVPQAPINPAIATTPGPVQRIATAAQFRRSQVRGAFVFTPVDVTGPAKLTQRVSAQVAGRTRSICSDRSEPDSPGRVVVRCRLPQWALERLDEEPLKLSLRVGFVPDFGAPRLAKRSLTAPAR